MFGRAIRFVGVGGLATLVHIAVAMAVEAGLGLAGLAANLAGWFAAVTLSYLGHLHVTFGAVPAHAIQGPRFVFTSLLGLAVSSGIVTGVTALGGSFAAAMALVAVGVPVMTYLMLQFWVFDGTRPADRLALSDVLIPLAAGAGFLAILWGATFHHDVVWYHVATRKWLDGAALYTEIVEVNPPLNFYLTLPVIWLADLTGLDDTGAQHLVLAGLMTVVLWLVARELRAADFTGRQRAVLLAGMGAVLSVLSIWDAGQREHLFILMALPWLVSRIAAEGDRGRAEAGLALLAAVGMCLKPFFVVFPAIILILEAARTRRIAPFLSPSALVFLATGLAYVAAVAAFHPTYLIETLPMARLVYGAYGADMINVVGVVSPFLVALACAAAWTLSRPGWPKGADIFFAVTFAGVVSYLWQGTGFGYHALPFVTFGAIACLFAALDARCRVIALVAIATMTYEVVQRGHQNDAFSRIIPVTESEGPVERLLVISSHVFAGPTVAVEAGAEWVSSYPAQWLVPGALGALARTDCAAEPARCAEIVAIADRNRDDLIASIREGRPDMIVFDKNPGYFEDRNFDWHGWLDADPAYAGLIAGYRLRAEDDRFTYWMLR